MPDENDQLGGAPAADGSADRAQRIAAIMLDVAERRERGDSVDEAQIIAANGDLMPELEAELAALREVRRAFLAARKAGPMPQKAVDAASPPESRPQGAVATESAIVGYSIEREISAGGQGTVYRAIQESTGRVVAIKVIPGGPFVSSRNRERFEREAGILARLDHPNIVGILDRGRTADGSLFMVMDFIDGCALDEYLDKRRGAGLGERDVAELFATIAEAVEEAHQRGIMHRDLKPSNIRIDARGRPHILDFGLARLSGVERVASSRAQAATQTGQIVGSLPWASPEQVRGEIQQMDVRSDVYSLGVMLYYALAGVFPYSVVGTIPEVIDQILSVVPHAPGTRVKSAGREISPGLDAIVLKALSKPAGQRQASAGKLAEDLRSFLAGTYRIEGVVERRGWKWGGMVFGVLVLGVTAALLPWKRWLGEEQTSVVELPSLANSVGIRLVRVPAGEFWMGSSSGTQGRGSDEFRHRVRLSRDYWLSVTEVTQAQYKAVMGRLPCPQSWEGDDLPVQGVAWNEAKEFCLRMSEREREQKRVYRLPTEAEWEYACNSGTGLAFGGTGKLQDMGWYQGNSAGRAHPVASKLPNLWGLYDMHGGVWEWCEDGYQPAYPVNESIDPKGLEGARSRVLRGGSILEPEHACRAARRRAQAADWQAKDVGFRVAMDAESDR